MGDVEVGGMGNGPEKGEEVEEDGRGRAWMRSIAVEKVIGTRRFGAKGRDEGAVGGGEIGRVGGKSVEVYERCKRVSSHQERRE
jgi:hypothetical protein